SAWTDLNRPAARPDACDPAACASMTTTDLPARAACSAVLSPSAPAPITTRSALITGLCTAKDSKPSSGPVREHVAVRALGRACPHRERQRRAAVLARDRA